MPPLIVKKNSFCAEVAWNSRVVQVEQSGGHVVKRRLDVSRLHVFKHRCRLSVLFSKIFTTDIEITLHRHSVEGTRPETKVEFEKVEGFELVHFLANYGMFCLSLLEVEQRLIGYKFLWLVMRLEILILVLLFYDELIVEFVILHIFVCYDSFPQKVFL